MEFKRDECRFTIPDRPTVRQQIAYFAETSGAKNDNNLLRLWFGTRTLIQEWECDTFKPDVNIDEVTNPKITEIIIWAAFQVRLYLNGLEELPKNS